VRKIVLIERLLQTLSIRNAQDSRLNETEKLNKVVEPSFMDDEKAQIGRFLRPGRNFKVNDPLAFNVAFRALQVPPPRLSLPPHPPTPSQHLRAPRA
jgi:hypothetical protein